MTVRGDVTMDRQLYELIPEEGKHLADSRDTEGAVRGVYLDDESNRPCGAGEFIPVDIDDDEDSDSLGDNSSGGNLDDGALAGIGILVIGVGIGVAVTKAYPHVKEWVTTTAVPEVKKFWRRITKKESEQVIECAEAKTMPILMKPEEFSQSIDSVVNEFHADMNSEEAQQHLLNIMCAAMYMASEIRQLSSATLKDEERLAWGAAMEKLTTKSVTDGINRILEGEVLALDEAHIKALTECLGGALIENGVFIPIENRRIKEALLVHPREQREGEQREGKIL